MWFRLRSSLFVTILPFLDAFFLMFPEVSRKLDRQRIGRAVFSSLFCRLILGNAEYRIERYRLLFILKPEVL